MHQILLRPEVSLRCLNRSMTEQQLDVLQFSARCPAELGASPSRVARRDPRHAGSFCVPPEELPDDLLAQALTANLITVIHRPEYISLR